MQVETEAPVQEPRPFQSTGISLSGVRAATGAGAGRRARRPRPARSAAGEVVAVVGPSGCGKSTLLELVAGLQEPDAGAVSVMGAAPARERLAASAYMPQRDLLLPWRDALGNAALALECQGVASAEARRRAAPLFERFGLAEFERARPAALSGGMRQRVAFLRTLLAGRPVLLLDEPFGALDSITRVGDAGVAGRGAAAEPRTVLLVTHDVEEALLLADRVAVLVAAPGPRGGRARRRRCRARAPGARRSPTPRSSARAQRARGARGETVSAAGRVLLAAVLLAALRGRLAGSGQRSTPSTT